MFCVYCVSLCHCYKHRFDQYKSSDSSIIEHQSVICQYKPQNKPLSQTFIFRMDILYKTITALFLLFCGSTISTSFPLFQEDVELIENGTTYKIISVLDGNVITALDDGVVITDVWKNTLHQKWTFIEHHTYPEALQFINHAVPYNDLSGFEDDPENPGVFPRPLTLTKYRIMPDLEGKAEGLPPTPPWNILIRFRWCLQNRGRFLQMDIDDCEYHPAPWQYWRLQIVSLQDEGEEDNPSQWPYL